MSFLVQKSKKQLLRPNFFLTPKWGGEGTLPPFSWALLPLSHPEFRVSFWLSYSFPFPSFLAGGCSTPSGDPIDFPHAQPPDEGDKNQGT